MERFIDTDGHIVVTFMNAGYFDFIRNFSENLRRIPEIKWTLCVVCIDLEGYQLCCDHHIEAIPYFEKSVPTKYSSYNDANWRRVTFTKFDVLHWVLSSYKDVVRSLTYMDTDIHVYADFVPYLKALPRHDVLIQSDHNSLDPSRTSPILLCTGFFHVQNNEMVRSLFQYADLPIDRNRFVDDQQFFNARLQEDPKCRSIKLKQLDRLSFPNGVFVPYVPKVIANPVMLPGAPPLFLIHYNYLVGTEKQKRMRENNHWFI